MKSKKIVCLFALLPFILLHSQSLDEGLNQLSGQISEGMIESNKTRIAVIEFSDLNGNITELGKYLSEELTSRLFMSKKFRVIERQLLNKVLEEHKLNSTGLIEEKTVKELGKILGVEAICSGTITDLGESVKINARLISTETGSLFSVASTGIFKDEAVKKLLSKISRLSAQHGTVNGQTGSTDNIKGKILYYEDFSSIEEGQVPSNWLGTEHVLVKTGRQNYLTSFERGANKIQIPCPFFSKDWKIEFYFNGMAFNLYIGKLFAGIVPRMGFSWEWKAGINNSFVDIKFDKTNSVLVALEKKGEVFHLFIDGASVVVTRIPKFEKPNSFIVDFGEAGFQLYKISLSEL